jgi:RNA polymerase sigma-70 factor, ECF subfamily
MARDPKSKEKIVEEWVRLYSRALFSYAATRLASASDAEDVVQEAFLKAYRSYDSFKPGTDAKAWLLRILLNTIRDHYRRAQSRGATVPLDEVDEGDMQAAVTLKGPEEIASDNELGESLQAALAKLPEQLATPLLLRELGEQSYKEIAGALEIPIGTVMSRLSRARQLLVKFLDGAKETKKTEPVKKSANNPDKSGLTDRKQSI